MLSISGLANSLSRMTGGWMGQALALSIMMGCSTSGCELDRRVIGGGPSDGGGGEGGMTVTDGGAGGDGGMGVSLITGSQYIPAPLHPTDAAALPPTRALLLWQNAEIPAGRTFESYELCRTAGPATEIDDASECPNSLTLPELLQVLDPLAVNTTYRWKVRARYDEGHYSEWSAVRVFSSDDSLVDWLRFDGNATDSSAAGNSGTLMNGAGFGGGIDGMALQCDGTDDYVDLGSGLNLSGPLTVSAWIYGNGTPTSADSGILSKGGLNYALTYHTNGEAYFYIGDGGNSVHAPVSNGAWHHVVGVFDGTTAANGMRFYLDGVLAASGTSSTATTGAAGSLWIGRYNASYFRGLIDNVTIYNGALSDEAILNEYCASQASGGVDPLPAACLP